LQYDKIAAEIEQVEGIVAHGLLLGAADAVVIADQQQGVTVVQCDRQQQAEAAARGHSGAV
jgi:ribose 5-phosphate isomerase